LTRGEASRKKRRRGKFSGKKPTRKARKEEGRRDAI